MNTALSDDAIAQLFLEGRSFSAWQDRSVPAALLQRLYQLTSLGPTSANCCPSRIVFISSLQEKARLLPLLHEGNRAKTQAAPVTAILAYDLNFAEQLPYLFPHQPEARDWFADPQVAFTTAFRNASLQGAYFMLAARALGLDCGPMSGFDNAAVDAQYFAGSAVKSNFLCNLGYGERSSLFDRQPRLPFDHACRVL